MAWLDQVYFGNTVQAWITAALITVLTFAVLKLVQRVVIGRLASLAKRTHTEFDDLIVDTLEKTKFFFLLMVALYAGSKPLSLTERQDHIAGLLVVLILLLQGAIWGSSIITFWLGRTVKRRMEEDAASATTISALGFIAKIVLWGVILLLALDNLGINITALVTGLGIGGVAVALALQSILSDLFASLSIVIDKPFVIGDFIIVDDLLGTVEHIGLKTTRVRSLGGEQLVFSNSDLLKSRIRNYKRMFERRVVFSFGVLYQTPHAKLAEIGAMVREIIEGIEQTRFDRAHFKAYGDSSLDFEVVYYVKSPDYNVYMDIQQKINLCLFKKFEQEAVSFAYPTRTLFIEKTTLEEPAAEAGK